MHTLTENVKRESTAHTQYTSKKKKEIATTNYTRTKNTWGKNQEECNQLTRVNAK